MTAPTPEQMRALADEASDRILGMVVQIENEWGNGTNTDSLRQEGDTDVLLADRVAAALRAAADQLEAVQEVLDRAEAENAPHLYPADFTAILTADTAPQEDRDEEA